MSDKAPIYQIARFDDVFTKRDGKKSSGELRWVSMPIGFASGGYQALVEDFGDGAPAIYGAWCALVSIAAQCPTPGVLCSKRGRPITPERAASMAYMPAEPFHNLFAWATSEDVGWIEVASIEVEPSGRQPGKSRQPSGRSPDDSRQPSGPQNKTKHNNTGAASAACPEPAPPASGPETEPEAPDPADSTTTAVAERPPDDPVVMTFPVTGGNDTAAGDWPLRASLARELAELFPDLDHAAEFRSALAWVKAEPGRRKTSRGMRKFLTGWLDRSQNDGRGRSRGSPPMSHGERSTRNYLARRSDGDTDESGLGRQPALRGPRPPDT